ncbi:MAG: Rne/Rng family ribonuclease [Acidobacteriota bacterium]|nr:Rne/Rng family ribonuclease [Acidobacteriota bacterium]
MIKEMIVSSTALETKVAILEDDQLAELYIERNRNRGILANIYKGKVTKVLPGMQSAFVNIGLEKDAFLYVSDFIEDNEECDQVFTAAEDQMDTAIAEAEVQDKPQRRERKSDKGRWRERKERAEASRAAGQSSESESEAKTTVLEHWDISAETEREVETHLESDALYSVSDIPESAMPAAPAPEQESSDAADIALEGVAEEPERNAGSVFESPAVTENPESPAEESSVDTARMRDDGETFSFSADENPKSGFARRRGAATRRKRYTAARTTHRPEHQSIDDMLQEGQEVLVQIAKEPIAKKGARVTSHIALPGRYLVYMPTVDHIGVSRKIGSDAERIRLKDIILRQRNRFPGGVIVRTAAEERSEEELVNDLNFLVRMWEDIRAKADKVSAPSLIHAEMNLVQRLLRDQFSFEFAAIRVDDEMEYQRIVEFVDKIFPNLVHRVKLYTKDNYIFDEYGITPEIDKLLQPKIWLKSGGYIVINQTEALVSIDINTGKFVGRGNSLEETITRTNLEAAKEIVRQVRLRDLGGIIVVDFIDMDERKNRKRVMEALSEEIAKDKAPSKILEFNEFGLVAITRKRVKQSLERALCQPCPYCSGSGMVKSIATTCYGIYHEIEKMRNHFDSRSEVMIRVHPDVARALRESESNVVEEIRHLLRRDVTVKSDPTLHIEHFNIVT